MERFFAGQSRYHGTMGSQASRELGEGDMRLRVTRLLSPIHSGSPRGEVRERCYIMSALRNSQPEVENYVFRSASRTGRSGNIFRTVSTSIREQELEIGGSHITDMTDSFHGQIRLEKLDTFAPDSQDVRELWAVRPHAIFVMMMYTLGSRRTFRGDLALCGLHEFLRLNVTDIHEGIYGYPRRDIRESFWNSFYISLSVGYDCYEFFRGDSFPVGCSC